MAKRKTYDWETIEKEYRAGVLSIREIAKTHGCSEGAIRKKAKQYSWDRDLTEKVKQKVRTELVRTEVRTPDPATEKEIVEQAAATQVEVVRSHRVKIKKGVRVVETLLDQLSDAADKRDEIEGDIYEDTKEESTVNRRNAMLKAVSLPSHASTAVSLSNALKNLVSLERQAFNIQDDTEEGGSELSGLSNDALLKRIRRAESQLKKAGVLK